MNIHRFTAVLILSALAAVLPAQQCAPEEPIIASVSVSGLRRTSEETVAELLHRFVGKPASEATPEAVAAVLVGTGLFENVRSAAVPDETGKAARLEVTVDEKFARIALPLFYLDEGGASGGGAFIDANAFGRADALMAVALFAPDGWFASAAFVGNRAGKKLRRQTLAAYLADKTREDADIYGDTLRRYRSRTVGAAVSASFAVLPFADAEASLSFRETAIGVESGSIAAPAEASRTISARIGTSADAHSWNGTFLSARSIRAGVSYAYALVGAPYWEADLRSAADIPLGAAFRLRLRAAAEYAPDAPAAVDRSPSAVGISLLPSDFAARSLAGAYAGAEIRLARFRFGTLSAIAGYEAAAAEGELIGTVGAHGPVGGIRLYVAKVAMPAMDLTVARNLATDRTEARFGIGMRF